MEDQWKWLDDVFGVKGEPECPAYIADIFKTQRVHSLSVLFGSTPSDVEELCQMLLIGDRSRLRSAVNAVKQPLVERPKFSGETNHTLMSSPSSQDRPKKRKMQSLTPGGGDSKRISQKSHYIVSCAVKRLDHTGRYVRSIEPGFSVRKARFPHCSTPMDIVTALIAEFKIDTSTAAAFTLLNSLNEEASFTTFKEYYDTQKQRYVGTTRIYLGMVPKKQEIGGLQDGEGHSDITVKKTNLQIVFPSPTKAVIPDGLNM